MFGIKDKVTEQIVSTTDQEQSAFGGPWGDPAHFEFVPDYIPPVTESQAKEAVMNEARRLISVLTNINLPNQDPLDIVADAIDLLDDQHSAPLTGVAAARRTAMKNYMAYRRIITAARSVILADIPNRTQEQLVKLVNDVSSDPAWPKL